MTEKTNDERDDQQLDDPEFRKPLVDKLKADYAKNDPKGWMGDPKRGAALGRRVICTLKPDYTGYIYVYEVVLVDGGYDRCGTYWGGGEPLWWCFVKGDEHELEQVVRGPVEHVVGLLKARFPDAQISIMSEKI